MSILKYLSSSPPSRKALGELPARRGELMATNVQTRQSSGMIDNEQSLFAESLQALLSRKAVVQMQNNPKSILHEGYKSNPVGYPIMRYIMDAAVQVPYKVMVGTKGGKIEPALESDSNGLIQEYFDDETEEAALGYLLNLGNSFVEGFGSENGVNAGKWRRMQSLPSTYVAPVLSGDREDPIESYTITEGQWNVRKDKRFIIHAKHWNPYTCFEDRFQGLSPNYVARVLITACNEAMKELAGAYGNGGARRIITAKQSQPFSKQWGELLRDSIQRNFGNALNRHATPPIAGDAVDVHKIGDTPSEMGMLEAFPLLFEMQCQIYGVPSALLSSKASTLDNKITAEKQFYNSCVIPNKNRFASKFTRQVCRAEGNQLFCMVDASHIEALQEKKDERIKRALLTGGYSMNELRIMEGEEPLEDARMDEVLAPKGSQFLDDMYTSYLNGLELERRMGREEDVSLIDE